MFNFATSVKVTNAYLSLKVREHNLTSLGKAFHMDTFAMTDIWKGKHERLKMSCKFDLFCILLLVLMPILYRALCTLVCAVTQPVTLVSKVEHSLYTHRIPHLKCI